MSKRSDEQFIKELQRLAASQARWQDQQLLPPPLAGLMALIGRYPLQALLISSLLGALVMEVWF